jgi:hypothetical protein
LFQEKRFSNTQSSFFFIEISKCLKNNLLKIQKVRPGSKNEGTTTSAGGKERRAARGSKSAARSAFG